MTHQSKFYSAFERKAAYPTINKIDSALTHLKMDRFYEIQSFEIVEDDDDDLKRFLAVDILGIDQLVELPQCLLNLVDSNEDYHAYLNCMHYGVQLIGFKKDTMVLNFIKMPFPQNHLDVCSGA